MLMSIKAAKGPQKLQSYCVFFSPLIEVWEYAPLQHQADMIRGIKGGVYDSGEPWSIQTPFRKQAF